MKNKKADIQLNLWECAISELPNNCSPLLNSYVWRDASHTLVQARWAQNEAAMQTPELKGN